MGYNGVVMKYPIRHVFIVLLLLLISGCTTRPTDVVVEKQAVEQPVAMEKETVGEKDKPVTVEVNLSAGDQANGLVVEYKAVAALPAKVDLNVAFASQAPNSDWSLPYQEACEEAALIQTRKYFYNEKLDKAIMDAEIKKVVEWETAHFNLYTDTALSDLTTPYPYTS